MSVPGKADARVQLRDRRVVPLGNLAEEDVGQNRSAEFQLLRDARDVVHRHITAEHRREVKDLARRGVQLLLRHRPIRCAEEDRLAGDLTNPGARAQRLVVDLDIRVQLVVLGKPLRIDRIREGGAGPGDLNFLSRQSRCQRGNRRSSATSKKCVLFSEVCRHVISSLAPSAERSLAVASGLPCSCRVVRG